MPKNSLKFVARLLRTIPRTRPLSPVSARLQEWVTGCLTPPARLHRSPLPYAGPRTTWGVLSEDTRGEKAWGWIKVYFRGILIVRNLDHEWWCVWQDGGWVGWWYVLPCAGGPYHHQPWHSQLAVRACTLQQSAKQPAGGKCTGYLSAQRCCCCSLASYKMPAYWLTQLYKSFTYLQQLAKSRQAEVSCPQVNQLLASTLAYHPPIQYQLIETPPKYS